LEPYEVAATVFGIIMLLLTTRELMRRRMDLLQYASWLVLWLGLILLGTVPQFYITLLHITQALGMLTPIHFVTTFSILILFAATYILGKRIAELNEKVSTIAQHIALRDIGGKTQRSRQQEENQS
jgi:hypothetical protein